MEWADVSVKGGFSAIGDCRLGPLAQLVEHRTFNPWVVGSIPTGPLFLAKVGKPPVPCHREPGVFCARHRGAGCPVRARARAPWGHMTAAARIARLASYQFR